MSRTPRPISLAGGETRSVAAAARRSNGWSAARALFGASVCASLAVAWLNIAVLLAFRPQVVCRELTLFTMLFGPPWRPVLRLGWPSVSTLLEHPFVLGDPWQALQFAGLATAVSLLVGLLAACALMPLLAVAVQLVPALRHGRWTQTMVAAGLLVGFALPGFGLVAQRLFYGRGTVVVEALTIAAAALVWCGLVAALRSAGRVRQLVESGVAVLGALTVLVWSGVGVAAALGYSASAQPAAAGNRPNILLISVDSLRPDHLHTYGYARETSPHIDALAREGVRFATAVSPTSWTLPAHLSLLTGMPPERHGVIDDATRLRDDALFLSEALWTAGYTTAGFVSAPYLDAVYGFSQGFDHYDDYTIAKQSVAAAHSEITSPRLVGIFDTWLDGWLAGRRERPFFAFLHFWDVHYDYAPPPPYDRMFDPDYTGPIDGAGYEGDRRIVAGMDPRDLAHIIALYDGEIRFTDHHIGLIVERLRRAGVLDDTLIVLTADHGEEFFEHGEKGHRKTLYDESILVPLIMRYPARIGAGRVVEEQVRLIDVAPTILSLAGVPAPPAFAAAGDAVPAAQDLQPWITGAAPVALPAFAELVTLTGSAFSAIRTRGYKLITTPLDAHRGELYDLRADPGEQRNVADAEQPGPALRNRMRAALSRWRSAAADTRLSRSLQIDDAQRERLRALGYLD